MIEPQICQHCILKERAWLSKELFPVFSILRNSNMDMIDTIVEQNIKRIILGNKYRTILSTLIF